jgi:hypothetical protein
MHWPRSYLRPVTAPAIEQVLLHRQRVALWPGLRPMILDLDIDVICELRWIHFDPVGHPIDSPDDE